MNEDYEVVIIGAGPAGSTAAAYLARAGVRVAIIERDNFPRFHIGESLTGSAGDIIAELGLAEQMAEQEFPDKPGAVVIGQDARNEFFVPVLNPTWQVRRANFDQLLLRNAQDLGAVLIRGRVRTVEVDRTNAIRSLSYDSRADGAQHVLRPRVVIDASGQNCFLSRQGVATDRKAGHFDQQIACFTHYEGVQRDPGAFATNTTIFYSHQDHWAWIIPISPTIDSFGVVVPLDTYRARAKSADEMLAWGIENINPEIAKRLKRATMVEPVRPCSDYSYEVRSFVGPNWACIGDAHRFMDPIFSFGVSFGMMEGRDVALRIAASVSSGEFAESFADFQRWSNVGQTVASDLIRYFWKYPAFFGYQMQNAERRREVIQLFGGACFEPEGMTVPTLFRMDLVGDADEQADGAKLAGTAG